MDKKLDNIQLKSSQTDEILNNFRKQLNIWGLEMPAVESLIMDFGLGDYERVGIIECWVVNEVEAGYCGKFLFLFDGQRCPMHGHSQKHETFMVVKGKIRMTAGTEERIMDQGDVLVMPAGQKHSFLGIGNTLVLEISTPCNVDDNDFQDAAIAAWLKKSLS